MAAVDVLGTVADRLVQGMMFHGEHADLCAYLGVWWLAGIHEDGYEHDNRCLRKVRRLSIEYLGLPVPEGRQERGHSLDAFRGMKRWDVSSDAIGPALKDAMHAWIDWEAGTVTVLTSSASRLMDSGELLLYDRVKKIANDTSKELANARDLMREMEAVCWDMSHVLQMSGRN